MRKRHFLIGLILSGCFSTMAQSQPSIPDLPQLEKMIARYAPQKLAPDTSKLSAGDKKALQKLTEAARQVDHLFMQQYWSGDLALYEKLKKDTSPLGKARSYDQAPPRNAETHATRHGGESFATLRCSDGCNARREPSPRQRGVAREPSESFTGSAIALGMPGGTRTHALQLRRVSSARVVSTI